MLNESIILSHGSGGKLSQELFYAIFDKYFTNPILDKRTDSAVLKFQQGHLAFTTDSYVVNPIFFPNASIGSLAICGTVNDLAVSGATPLYISAGFIIEEGFPLSELESVVADMAAKAREARVTIVAGDTKVVPRGACDKIFITTSGIGLVKPEHVSISTGTEIKVGDKIIINGPIANHGMAILSERHHFNIQTQIISDCAPLNHLIQEVLSVNSGVHFMRDATRGGLATVLYECVENRSFGILIDEACIPIQENVKAMCDMLGYDPLYIANEGKVVMVVEEINVDRILAVMKKRALGKESIVIGEIIDHPHGKVCMQTSIGGRRILEMMAGDQLPRIC